MPTNKQRREAARRKLERQLQVRQERARRRRQGNVIASIVGAVVIVAVVVAFIAISSREKSNDAAGSSAATTTGATSASRPALPTRKASGVINRAPKKTSGPCKYAETAAGLKSGRLFDVGLPPDPSPTPKVKRTVTFTTSQGAVTAELDGANAPCNVQSLLYLIGKKFFDQTACPRSVNQGIFVVQCGDPSASTGGGPTYTVKDENLKGSKYPAGAIAMANSGANTNSSQFFFITKDSTAALGPKYTVVGQVTKGLNVLQKVAAAGDDGSNQAGGGRPNLDLIFTTVRVAAA